MEDEKSLSELGSLLEKLEIQPPTTESPAAANSNSGECPVCMLPPTYPVRLEACGHVFCFLCIKGVCLRAPSCPMCRAEISGDLAYNGVSEEQLLTPLQVKQETKSTDEVHWYYEGYKGWWEYDSATGCRLESAFQAGDQQLTVSLFGYPYKIDLSKMQQHSEGGGYRVRKIQRCEGEVPNRKGVAGIFSASSKLK